MGILSIKYAETIFTFVRKHAPIASQGSALPSECGGGKLTLREKAIKFLYSKNKNKEMTHTKKPSPLVLLQKERIGNVSCPRTRGKCQRS